MSDSPEIRLQGYEQLMPIGRGGEHYVYQQGPLIHKVNIFMAQKFLRGEMTVDEIESTVFRRQERHAKMRALIGQEYVAPEEAFVTYQRLPEETCRALAPNSALSPGRYGLVRTPLIVVQQDYFLEAEKGTNPNSAVLSIGDGLYAEERINPYSIVDFEQYRTLTAQLVFGKKDNHRYSDRQHYNWLGAHLSDHAIWENQEAFKDLHTKANHYTSETGEGLDLVGSFNGFVYTGPREGKSSFTLIDALYPVDCKLVEEAANNLLLLNNEVLPDLSRPQQLSILNGVHYVRTLNYIALMTGDTRGDNVPFMNMFEKAGQVDWRDDICERVYQVNRELMEENGRLSLIY